MDRTFSLRRHEVVEDLPFIGEFKNRWPALFNEQEVSVEFSRITTIPLVSKFMSQLDKFSAVLISVFRKKGGAAGQKINNILSVLDQDVPIEKRRECILKALVVYVNEEPSNLVKEYMDVEHDEAQTSVRDTTLGIYVIKPEGAHAADPYQDVGIIVEGIKILENLNNVANACSLMLGLIYALNLAYPQDLRYTFETFQKLFMELDANKLSNKVHTLKNKLLLSGTRESYIECETEIEDSLRNIEKKHRIGRRWQESDSDFQSTLKDVDCELRGQLISKARTESRERAVLLHLKRKYPDGQGIAIRLAKQVASSNKRLRQAIKEYNSIQWPPQMSIFPATIDFQEACDPSWHVYFCFDDTIEEDNVSRSLKRRGIDALHMKTRAAEEKSMLYQEMRTVTEHLHQQHAILCSAIKATDQPGAKAALIQRLQQLERKRHEATLMFHPHVPDIVPADNLYLCQALPMSSIQTLIYNDDGENNDSENEDDNDN
ncbi:hypothetical protein QQF64_020598 [Cirrhinus molitorella]|uniref:Uncharacterized protein n=1 Tax=Cirrhinus molitorella TaxID=172907 RepID=A0ABR3L9S2_9TELE